jgi:polyhydroxybutyrate depolymerase
MQISDMRSLAESEQFILVYPQGTMFDGVTHWNVGSWTEGSTSDDLGFVDKLINHISNNHNIDMKRIYAAGYSNGGFFSQELACNLSHNIAAIGTVVANMSTRTKDNCNPAHPTPIITISGTNDKEVSYDGTNFEGQISHKEVLNYWVNYNQTDTSPIISELPNINTTDGSAVRLYQYINGKNNVEIEHYKIINGGHDWPGSFGNMDINANSVIWNFVSQFDVNGKI